jgi:hypothetical protein
MYDELVETLFSSTVCAGLADGVTSLLDSLTVRLGGHINLFWFVFLLLGLFLFMGFIAAVKATKRLGSKKKVSPETSKSKSK